MSEYQVIARKFRPQTFAEVVGQEAIVTTLKNAIKFKRLAHAYLFCGSRGTGKTTLARLFAKALNCPHLSADYEPCNQCASCREITSGMSLDVLEIDGASHRGIEDIRQINDTVGYAASAGGYKIYLIDEVHMLTKEAFNALLKTLEEPPPKVKFFFATTEPHKVLSTILSRCQRFNLSRISLKHLMAKLQKIVQQLGVEVEEEALKLLAQQAQGGLRDAESLLDQVLAFQEGRVTVASVTAILGLMPQDIYFEIDAAGQAGELTKAFEIAQRVFTEGKDLAQFVEGLMHHLRTLLIIKLAGQQETPLLLLTAAEKARYHQTAAYYTQEQCLDLIEFLLEASQNLRSTYFGQASLENVLLHVMRSHFRLPIEHLVQRLSELDQLLKESNRNTSAAPVPAPTLVVNSPPKKETPVKALPAPLKKNATLFDSSVSEDPTPTLADLGKSTYSSSPAIISKTRPSPSPTPVVQPTNSSSSSGKLAAHQYDTLFHFAAIELEGKLQKSKIN